MESFFQRIVSRILIAFFVTRVYRNCRFNKVVKINRMMLNVKTETYSLFPTVQIKSQKAR